VGAFLWLGLFLAAVGLGITGALYLPGREPRFVALDVRVEQPDARSTLVSPRVDYVAAPSPSGSVEHVAANASIVTVPSGLAGRTISVRLYVDDDVLEALAEELGVTPRLDAAGRRLVTMSARSLRVQAVDGQTLRASALPPSYRQTWMWGDTEELTLAFAQPPAEDPPVSVLLAAAARPPWDQPIKVAAAVTLDASYDPLDPRFGEPLSSRPLSLVLSDGTSPFSIVEVDIAPDEAATSWRIVLNGVEGTDFVGPASEVTAAGLDGLFRTKATRRSISSGDEVSMVAEEAADRPLFVSYLDGRLSVTGVARSARTAFGDDLLPTRWDLWPVWAQTFVISAGASAVVGLTGYGVGLWRQTGRIRRTSIRRRVVRQGPSEPRQSRRRRQPPPRPPAIQ